MKYSTYLGDKACGFRFAVLLVGRPAFGYRAGADVARAGHSGSNRNPNMIGEPDISGCNARIMPEWSKSGWCPDRSITATLERSANCEGLAA